MATANLHLDHDKYEQLLFWPDEMLQFLQQHAVRCDSSLSFLVQHAWTTSFAHLAASDRSTLESAIRPFGGKKRKQALFYPGTMIGQFAEQAKRLDASESFVVQAAVALAKSVIEQLPVFDELGGQ